MIRTTPPRPFDVAAAFPQLAPLARTATRLHPRPGSPSPYQSSIGGPLLWPSRQPWLYCDKWHEGPVCPLLPVAQLYVRDVPQLRSPGRTDLLQVLWCPSEHPPHFKPRTELFWRTAADVTHVLTSPPSPYEAQRGYTPEPCVLAPEQVTEYPHFLELDRELRQQLSEWSTWQAVGVVTDDSDESDPEAFYIDALSVAPGWKVGGWAPWGLTDPIARFCIHCGSAMNPLLTIASDESRDYRRSWVPLEDQAIPEIDNDKVSNPPGIQVSDANNLQLYVCPTCFTHTDLIQ
ncbi:hypothetical protein [Streptomyces mangrovisoli]|uniref:DUF1963 domain-containing protein n=1 Tax=Streptomyces mangrovisoli TaxID=1428628 RepID=A0A1J4P3Z0_9ACTN|nr:hypothetical protein [Streptomyces mangrovisoli]OIJ68476.1 hypothetical protein WN71_007800 [Streptomyces mangrovisoli]